MIKLAIYGKGGIGKSTTVSNISASLAMSGFKVMQIGCDPKADSTTMLRGKKPIKTVLDLIKEKKPFELSDMITEGFGGVLCVEAGGPTPGLGCAGRGIISALEKLSEMGAYEKYQPDVVLYDVLGDVVCGGFSSPMRSGYADKIFIITSGENMSIHAAANIATAIDNFKGRGYASLGGIILNRRNVKCELEKVSELCGDINSSIIGDIERSDLVQEAEDKGMSVMECFPNSHLAESYSILAQKLLEVCNA